MPVSLTRREFLQSTAAAGGGNDLAGDGMLVCDENRTATVSSEVPLQFISRIEVSFLGRQFSGIRTPTILLEFRRRENSSDDTTRRAVLNRRQFRDLLREMLFSRKESAIRQWHGVTPKDSKGVVPTCPRLWMDQDRRRRTNRPDKSFIMFLYWIILDVTASGAGSANGYRIPCRSLCFYKVYSLPHRMVPHPVPQVPGVRRIRWSEAVPGSPETHFESSQFSFSSRPLACTT